MKKVKLELTEEEFLGVYAAANLGVMHYGKYPYHKKEDEEGFDDYETERKCMYKGISAFTKGAVKLYDGDAGGKFAEAYAKYLPTMGKYYKDNFGD
jgi:hypothetical protein